MKLSAEVAGERITSLLFTSSYIGCRMEGNPAFNVANILQQGNDIAFICFNVFHALIGSTICTLIFTFNILVVRIFSRNISRL